MSTLTSYFNGSINNIPLNAFGLKTILTSGAGNVPVIDNSNKALNEQQRWDIANNIVNQYGKANSYAQGLDINPGYKLGQALSDSRKLLSTPNMNPSYVAPPPAPLWPKTDGQGNKTYQDGTIVYSNGITNFANGTVQYADGSVKSPNGDISYKDGTIKYANGDLKASNGQYTYANGDIKMPDGTVNFKDGTIQHPDGSINYSNGDIKQANGDYLFKGAASAGPTTASALTSATQIASIKPEAIAATGTPGNSSTSGSTSNLTSGSGNVASLDKRVSRAQQPAAATLLSATQTGTKTLLGQ